MPYQTRYQSVAMVFVNFSFSALHKYPDAPDQVHYLRYPHRHNFKVRVELEVFHDDREIEFIMLKEFLESLVKFNDLDYKSCEMMCDFFHAAIVDHYKLDQITDKTKKSRRICIEVSEDGENGAFKYYMPEQYEIEGNDD